VQLPLSPLLSQNLRTFSTLITIGNSGSYTEWHWIWFLLHIRMATMLILLVTGS